MYRLEKKATHDAKRNRTIGNQQKEQRQTKNAIIS